MVRVNVKWNKLSFELDLDPTEGVTTFKNQLYSLTNVPPTRQKLMAKGGWPGILKDDANLLDYNITDGLAVTLMGTADVIEAKVGEVKFVEDMTSAERAIAGTELPSGLTNLGNTCYMNATVQCLRFVDGFNNLLGGHPVTSQLQQLVSELDRSSTPILPYRFMQALRNYFPQFAEMKQGRYMQQDADEFFGAIMSAISQQSSTESQSELMQSMGIQLEETLSCNESVDEPIIRKQETVFKLICNINGGAGSQASIDHMVDGIKLGLEGSIEKYSEVLHRNSLWNRKQRIKSLPKVLCVQFLRFFWKATPDSRESAGAKCKILRAVNFTETLDVFDFCTEELQSVLRTARHRQRDNVSSELAAAGSSEANSTYPPAAATNESTGFPETFTGQYELCGVVTHQGRSADSGHYMSYVRNAKNNNWIKFDDDKVSEARLEEVLRLSGGGDRDMAYFCFYRMKF